MAAIFAAEGPTPVQIVESTADGGRKILISGGGRCNILPAALHPERFVTDSPAHVLRGLLRAWPVHEQRRFFEGTVGLPLALEQATGKWFPASNRAREVRDALVALARRRGVMFRFASPVTAIAPLGNAWTVETGGGGIRASRVVLATGGLGADDRQRRQGLGMRRRWAPPAPDLPGADAAHLDATAAAGRRVAAVRIRAARGAPPRRPAVSSSRIGDTAGRPSSTCRTCACARRSTTRRPARRVRARDRGRPWCG